MKVDFVAKTITITAECAEKMNDPDTTEYRASVNCVRTSLL